MSKALLILTGAAVALTAMPADARHRHGGWTYGNALCAKWRHGHCVLWRHGHHMGAYRVGYVFGPRYAYSPYATIPRTYVNRYGLRPTYRYVYRNETVYVVHPRTYRVVRVIRR